MYPKKTLTIATIALLTMLVIPQAYARPIFAFDGAEMTYHATYEQMATGQYATRYFQPLTSTEGDYTIDVTDANDTAATFNYSPHKSNLLHNGIIVYKQPSPGLEVSTDHVTYTICPSPANKTANIVCTVPTDQTTYTLYYGGLLLSILNSATKPQLNDGHMEHMHAIFWATLSATYIPDYIPPTETDQQIKAMDNNIAKYMLAGLKPFYQKGPYNSTEISNYITISKVTNNTEITHTTLAIPSGTYDAVRVQFEESVDAAYPADIVTFSATASLTAYYHAQSGLLLSASMESDIDYHTCVPEVCVPAYNNQVTHGVFRAGTTLVNSNFQLSASEPASTTINLPVSRTDFFQAGVKFHINHDSLKADVSPTDNGIRFTIQPYTMGFFANEKKIGALTLGMTADIQPDKQGHMILTATSNITLQVDSLKPYTYQHQNTIDLTQKAYDLANKLKEKGAEALAGSSIVDIFFLTIRPELLKSWLGSVLPGDVGATIITVQSPANLFVTSPTGQQIGMTPQGVVNTMTNAAYFGPEPQVVWIAQSEKGEYNVTLTGTSNGDVTFAAGTYKNEFVPQEYTVHITTNETPQFKVNTVNRQVTESSSATQVQQTQSSQSQTTQADDATVILPLSTLLAIVAVSIVIVVGAVAYAVGKRRGARSSKP